MNKLLRRSEGSYSRKLMNKWRRDDGIRTFIVITNSAKKYQCGYLWSEDRGEECFPSGFTFHSTARKERGSAGGLSGLDLLSSVKLWATPLVIPWP